MGRFEDEIKKFPEILEWANGMDVSAMREYLLDNKMKIEFSMPQAVHIVHIVH